MERPRTTGGPVYRRQQSNTSSSSGAPESPTISPLHHHHQQQQRYARSPSTGAPAGNVRRAQNTAARAAAQRLARVMAHQPGEDESGSDDESMAPPVEILSTPRRAARSPSPAVNVLSFDHDPIHISPLKVCFLCSYLFKNTHKRLNVSQEKNT